jgi:hypothetical protein
MWALADWSFSCRPIVVAEKSDIVIHIPEDFAHQGARCAWCRKCICNVLGDLLI